MLGRNRNDDEPRDDGRFGREPGPAATRGGRTSTTTGAGEDPRHRPAQEPADGHAGARVADEPEHEAGTLGTAGSHPRGTVAADQMRAVRERQRAEFGGIAWGSAIFGWLVAFGVAALLTGLLAAVGAATGLTKTADQETVGLAGGIGLLVAAALAYFSGGYVAGRLARFDGARNGLAVWLVGLILTVLLGALAYVGGSEYNVVEQANLPRLTVGEETATTAGLIAMAAMLLVTVLAAVLGGKAGERFHTKVDRHATR